MSARLNAIRGGNMSGDSYRVLNMPRASIGRVAALSPATGTPTPVVFDTVEYDTDSMVPAAGTWLVANTPGLYAFYSWFSWASNATDFRRLQLTKGTGEIYADNIVAAVTGAITSHGTSALIPMNKDEYVQCIVTQTSGGGLAIQPNTAGAGLFEWNGLQACLVSTLG